MGPREVRPNPPMQPLVVETRGGGVGVRVVEEGRRPPVVEDPGGLPRFRNLHRRGLRVPDLRSDLPRRAGFPRAASHGASSPVWQTATGLTDLRLADPRGTPGLPPFFFVNVLTV